MDLLITIILASTIFASSLMFLVLLANGIKGLIAAIRVAATPKELEDK